MSKNSFLLLLGSLVFLFSCDDGSSGSPAPEVRGEFQHVIMVYLDGDNDLESYAISDLNEMEAVNLKDEGIKVIALFDRSSDYDVSNGNWTGTRLYEVEYDTDGLNNQICSRRVSGMGLNSLYDSELNMGSSQTLSSFVSFCKASYKADYYSLVLWNHGDGWRNSEEEKWKASRAVCWDESSSDILYLSEIRRALENSKLDLIGFDACLMGMIEVAYELKGIADFMVASEEVEPGNGWDYRGWFSRFIQTEKSMMNMLSSITGSYGNSGEGSTLSGVDLRKCSEVISTLDVFSQNLMYVDDNRIAEKRNQVESYYDPANVDLYHLALLYSEVTGSAALRNALDSYILSNYSSSQYANSKGVAIYYPILEKDFYADYNEEIILFPGACHWDEFLAKSLNVTRPVPDAYEPDNSMLQSIANSRVITLENEEYHNFHIEGDEDWMVLNIANAGTYKIHTYEADYAADTILILYNSNGEYLCDNDDAYDYSYYSKIEQNLQPGTYYIKVESYDDDWGTDYYIKVEALN